MDKADELYLRLLEVGFLVMRQAVLARDLDWVKIEVEWLHNVPSLIGEKNHHRHLYFWNCERTTYLEWLQGPEREYQRSRMATYYEPFLNELEPIILALEGKD